MGNKINIAYTVTPTAVVFMYDQKTFTVNKGDERYTEVRNAIREEDFDAIPRLLDIKGRLISESNGGIYLMNGMLRCDKYEIPALLATRIIGMFQEGFSIKPLTLFLENLMSNPNESGTIVEDLYGFIEKSNLPITADGHFLAYKTVRTDFTDIYTGKMDNSIGTIVEMERSKCDFNRDRTCSSGLHFCSESYLGHYGTRSSSQVVIVKVNPRDVTSIPSDYNDAKGRACRYEVVEAISWDQLITPLFTSDHSDPVEDEHADSVLTDARWELRNGNDGSLVNSFSTRQGARDARSGNAGLYIVDTNTGEVVAGQAPVSNPDSVDGEHRWEIRRTKDNTLVDTFSSRALARNEYTRLNFDYANNDPMYIWDTVNLSVDYGIRDWTLDREDEEEPEYEPPAKTNPSAVLNERLVREIRKILDGGHYESINELALMYGVSERTIRRIRDRESWTHVV